MGAQSKESFCVYRVTRQLVFSLTVSGFSLLSSNFSGPEAAKSSKKNSAKACILGSLQLETDPAKRRLKTKFRTSARGQFSSFPERNEKEGDHAGADPLPLRVLVGALLLISE